MVSLVILVLFIGALVILAPFAAIAALAVLNAILTPFAWLARRSRK